MRSSAVASGGGGGMLLRRNAIALQTTLAPFQPSANAFALSAEEEAAEGLQFSPFCSPHTSPTFSPQQQQSATTTPGAAQGLFPRKGCHAAFDSPVRGGRLGSMHSAQESPYRPSGGGRKDSCALDSPYAKPVTPGWASAAAPRKISLDTSCGAFANATPDWPAVTAARKLSLDWSGASYGSGGFALPASSALWHTSSASSSRATPLAEKLQFDRNGERIFPSYPPVQPQGAMCSTPAGASRPASSLINTADSDGTHSTASGSYRAPTMALAAPGSGAGSCREQSLAGGGVDSYRAPSLALASISGAGSFTDLLSAATHHAHVRSGFRLSSASPVSVGLPTQSSLDRSNSGQRGAATHAAGGRYALPPSTGADHGRAHSEHSALSPSAAATVGLSAFAVGMHSPPRVHRTSFSASCAAALATEKRVSPPSARHARAPSLSGMRGSTIAIDAELAAALSPRLRFATDSAQDRRASAMPVATHIELSSGGSRSGGRSAHGARVSPAIADARGGSPHAAAAASDAYAFPPRNPFASSPAHAATAAASERESTLAASRRLNDFSIGAGISTRARREGRPGEQPQGQAGLLSMIEQLATPPSQGRQSSDSEEPCSPVALQPFSMPTRSADAADPFSPTQSPLRLLFASSPGDTPRHSPRAHRSGSRRAAGHTSSDSAFSTPKKESLRSPSRSPSMVSPAASLRLPAAAVSPRHVAVGSPHAGRRPTMQPCDLSTAFNSRAPLQSRA